MPSSHRLPARPVALLAVLALGLASSPELQAGIRYISEYGDYPATLRNQKWGVAVSGIDPRSPRCEFGPPTVRSPDAKQLVVLAVLDLPGSADQVPLETRQELARIAEQALNTNGVKEGRIGNVEYRVGRYSFQNRPDTTRKGPGIKVETDHMPFVAVRIAATGPEK